jgi:hypothetical protein
MSKEYYQKHRLEIIAKNNARHKANLQSNNYKTLVRKRKEHYNVLESVAIYYKKIAKLKKRLVRVKHSIEYYELKWGAERALRKKEIIEPK